MLKGAKNGAWCVGETATTNSENPGISNAKNTPVKSVENAHFYYLYTLIFYCFNMIKLLLLYRQLQTFSFMRGDNHYENKHINQRNY